MRTHALEYLGRDPLAHADLLVPLYRGSGEIVRADEGGVLLLERESGAHMLAAARDADALRLLDAVSGPALMSIHNGAAAREAARRFGLSITLVSHQAVWTGDRPPELPPSAFEIRPLDIGFAQRVNDLYSHNIGLDYIEARLHRGQLWGAFEGGTLAGFIGCHAEGSMGMLEVLPAYRRRGVGRLLAAFLVGAVMGRGMTPFSQFTVDNVASRALNRSLGMTIITQETIYWLEP